MGSPGFVYTHTLLLYICMMYVFHLKMCSIQCRSISTLPVNYTCKLHYNCIMRPLKVNRDLPPKGKLEV